MMVLNRDPILFRNPAQCEYGPDAIVDALRHINPSVDLRYIRYDQCMAPNQPSDSSFVPMTFPHIGLPIITDANTGHDAWTRLYASSEFIEWLLAHRLPAVDRWW